MPNINIDDAYILNETGAQVDKVTGLFTKDEDTTSGEKAFAQLNIGTAGSNRNLLDNPWWGLNEVVNQRENTSGQTTVSYSIDRWKMTAGSAYGNWSLGANGLTITAASGTYAVFQQLLEPRLYEYLAGKTVTCSALLSDGTVVSGTVQSVDWSSSTTVVVSGNLRLWLVSGGVFRVLVQGGDSFTIRAVKLELGSVSTLANDAPPNYAEELAKCQYYCRVIETSGYFAFGMAAGSAHIQTPLQYAMRARPSVSFTGSIALFGANDLTVSSIVVSAWGPSAICLDFVTTGATSRTPYIVNMSNAKIILSADL